MHNAFPTGFLSTRLDQRYRLDRLIGEGASAWVFAGQDARLERDVAVKVLKPQREAGQAELQRRFVAEGRTLAQLVHPNIVLVYDAGVTEQGFGYLVMELSHAGTLESELFRREVLSAEETVNLLLPLLGALACAHDRGIVHRDIKPANIILAGENGARCAKLLDFGIAKRSDSASTNSASGTPSYMAPEQASGKRASAAVDVWALGVVFFRCLSGQLPFAGETSLGALQKLVSERAPRFATVCPKLSPYLALALDRALERDPERRYSDMRSFAQALTTACVQDGIALAARPEPLGLAGFDSWTRQVDVEPTRPLHEPERAMVAGNTPRMRAALRRRTLVWIASAATLALVVAFVAAPAQVHRQNLDRPTDTQIQLRQPVPVHPVGAAAPFVSEPHQAEAQQGSVERQVTDGQAAALPAARKRRKATPQAPRARVESVLRDEAPERVSATTKSGLVKSWDW